MRQKIAFFDRRRGNPTTPTSTRVPWRVRRREREEPRRPSTSPAESDLNSIRINTADYPVELLRQYGDERINISSISNPRPERDQRPPSSNTNELERYQSDERDSRPRQNACRRPGECFFLTSGYRINPTASSSVKEIISATKYDTGGYDDGLFPFPEQSRENFFLRGKGCLLILFIVLALTTVVGLSWYFSCNSPLTKDSVHALITGNPVAKLLGVTTMDKTSEARYMWINHVVKNDENQILIAETIESRLNAEISPLLENYVDKIWDDLSSPPVTCHGGDRLMVAFSMTKAGSMPASITYETPCMNGPSSRSCVVKKQIADVRDLVVRLPSKSSRYMHAVRLEVDHSSKESPRNTSDVRHIQDFGTVSGQFRVELSDASRLALQRYCGQNRKAYSEDLLAEPVSARNTRLINVYELKRLYGLLSNASDATVRGSNAWDTRMLSTVVVDPLEHSRHSLTPIHVQQLLSRLHSVTDSQPWHGAQRSRSPNIAGSSPQENDLFRYSTTPSPHFSEKNRDVVAIASTPNSHLEVPMSSATSPLPPLRSSSLTQTNITQEVPSSNFQPPVSPAANTGDKFSQKKTPLPSQSDSPAPPVQRPSGNYTESNPRENETANDSGNEAPDHILAVNGDKATGSDQENTGIQDDTAPAGVTTGNSRPTTSDQGGQNGTATSDVTASSQKEFLPSSSQPFAAFPVNKETETSLNERRKEPTTHESAHVGSSVLIEAAHTPGNKASNAQTPSPLSPAADESVSQEATSLATKLTKPASLPHSQLSAGLVDTKERLAAVSAGEKQRANLDSTVITGAPIHKETNMLHSTTLNSVTQTPAQNSFSPPIEVPSFSGHGSWSRDQQARITQASNPIALPPTLTSLSSPTEVTPSSVQGGNSRDHQAPITQRSNSVTQFSAQTSLPSRTEELPSSGQRNSFKNQHAPMTQTSLSTQTGMAAAQELSPSMKGMSTSSSTSGVMTASPIQRTSSLLKAPSLTAQGGSPSPPIRSSPMRRSLTSAGKALPLTSGVTQTLSRTTNRVPLRPQTVLRPNQKYPLPRNNPPQPILHRAVTRTQMSERQPKQPDVSNWALQKKDVAKSSTKNEQTRVSSASNFQFRPQALSQIQKPIVRSRVP